MKVWHYALASTSLATGLFVVKLAQYPNVVTSIYAMTDSVSNILIVFNFAAMLGLLIGGALITIFLGGLRDVERTSIGGTIMVFVSEMMLTMSSLTQLGYSTSLLTCGYVVIFLMLLHKVARERVDVFYRSIARPTVSAELRFGAFILLLAFADYLLLRYTYEQFLMGHNTMLFYSLRIFRTLELLIVTAAKFAIEKYEFHYLEAYDEEHWENKANYVFCAEFAGTAVAMAGDCFILYLFGFSMMQFHAVLNICQLYSLTRKHFEARRAQNELEEYVVDAVPSDLDRDSTCVVCRDDMEIGVQQIRLAPKKLGCGHVIHRGCLKLWMGRSQDCPTCRRPVKSKPRIDHTASHTAHNVPDAHNGNDAVPQQERPHRPVQAQGVGDGPEVIPEVIPLANRRGVVAEIQNTGTAPGIPLVLNPGEWTTFQIQVDNDVRRVQIGESWYEFTED